jgi:hypothetical protein
MIKIIAIVALSIAASTAMAAGPLSKKAPLSAGIRRVAH